MGRHNPLCRLPRRSFERLEDRNLLALPPNFQDELIIGNLVQPVEMAGLPDGRMLVIQRAGEIVITDPSEPNAVASHYLTIPNVDSRGEKGLLNIVLDPDFELNRHLFVYYHNTVTDRARVSRFVHDHDHAHASDEVVVWEDHIVTSNQVISDHWGGILDFGPDGNLYLAIGDKKDHPAEAQDLSQSAGKILRIDPSRVDELGGWDFRDDGGNSGVNAHLIPDDNPFIDGPGGALDEVWVLGLRNPFRGGWDLASGRLIIGEVGGNDQTGPDASHEDLHVATVSDAGANFGWPNCEGPNCSPAPPNDYSAPFFSVQHPASRAIVGGPIHRTELFPSPYDNVLFFTDFTRGWLRYLPLDEDGNVKPGVASGGERFADFGDLGHPVALELGADGLYYVDIVGGHATGGGQLRRIRYSGGDQPPVILSVTADVQSGAPALTVNFSVEATDPEGQPLSYTWDFGDGTSGAGSTVSHVYEVEDVGPNLVRVSVSDGNLSTLSEPVIIEVGIPPTPEITRLSGDATFVAGETIRVSGFVTDDQPIAASNHRWTVNFLHDDHFHPVLTQVTGEPCVLEGTSCIELQVPSSGHDFSGDTGFEIRLSATDVTGLRGETSLRLDPAKVELAFSSNVPGGVDFLLDEVPRTGPFTLDTLVGFQHLVSAPEQIARDGDLYIFDHWSNNGTRQQTLVTPSSSESFAAIYINSGPLPTAPKLDPRLHKVNVIHRLNALLAERVRAAVDEPSEEEPGLRQAMAQRDRRVAALPEFHKAVRPLLVGRPGEIDRAIVGWIQPAIGRLNGSAQNGPVGDDVAERLSVAANPKKWTSVWMIPACRERGRPIH